MSGAHYELADATRADTAELVQLDERNFERGDRFSDRLWRAILEGAAAGKMLTLIARHQGVVVGAIVGEFSRSRRPGRLVVWSIAVDEPQRGGGLARLLMAKLLERTPRACTQVRLDARRDNARARRFYERLGFRQEREIRRAYADGTDAIRYATSVADLRAVLGRDGCY